MAALRQALASVLVSAAADHTASFRLSCSDERLGESLRRDALHEIFAETPADLGAATGFALGVAVRAAGRRPVLWVRQDIVDDEAGHPYAPGLTEFGLSPSALVVVRAGSIEGVLKAADDAAHCAALGALLIEPWGMSRRLDLAVSRRLSLAARAARVPSLMLRVAADPAPSTAWTRWTVRALTSQPLEANSPGYPAFAVGLVRHREGREGGSWRLEWNRDRASFQEQPLRFAFRAEPALSRPVVSLPVDGPVHSGPAPDGLRLAV